jgi:hypothetical protein
MTPNTYQKIVRSSAIYDVIVTSLFAFPIIAAFKIGLFQKVHIGLQLSGSFPAFEPMHLLFVNLMGCIVTLWSVLRIYNPIALYGLADAVGRLLFSGAMAFYLFAADVSTLIWFFLVPEILWGILQFGGYWQLNSKLKTMS